MIFEYEDAHGNRVDRYVRAGKNPPKFVVRGGVRYRRVYSAPGLARISTPFVSNFFAPWTGRGEPGREAPAYSSEGQPCFETKRQAQNFARKNGVWYGDRGSGPNRGL